MTTITKYEEQQQDLAILHTMADIALKSGKYKDFDHATIMNVFFTARALGVDPILALNSGFNIINGKINMGAHFMVSLARRAGHSLKVIELTKEKCIMLGKRKDNDDSIKYEYTYDEACDAGLGTKTNWKTNRKSMLYCACARHLFRMLFCDIAIPYDADEMNVDGNDPQGSSAVFVDRPETNVAEIKTIDCSPNKSSSEAFYDLRDHLSADGIATDRLQEWINLRAQMKNQTSDVIVDLCLDKNTLPKFKKAFLKFLFPAEPEVLCV